MKLAEQNRDAVCHHHNDAQNSGRSSVNKSLLGLLYDNANEQTWITEFGTLKNLVESSMFELAVLRELSHHLVVCEEQATLLNLLLDRLNIVVDYRDAALARLKNDRFTILVYRGAAQ